jgi:hypothetical protein
MGIDFVAPTRVDVPEADRRIGEPVACLAILSFLDFHRRKADRFTRIVLEFDGVLFLSNRIFVA